MSKVAILINTCDKYSDIWNPFFRILEKTWPEAKSFDIYLNTETLAYNDPFFNVNVLNCVESPKKTAWGKRLLQCLDRIENNYVLFLLEDFFFENKVNHQEFLKSVDYLERFQKLSMIALTADSSEESKDFNYCQLHTNQALPEYVMKEKFGYFKINAGPALWRKEMLKKITFKNDTPWAWEAFGSKRSWFINGQFYARRCDVDLIFDYDIEHGGAVHRGKWVGSKVPELNTKYNLGIDLNLRGIEEEKDFNPFGESPKPMYKRICTIVSNRLNALFGIIYGVFR